MTPAADQYRFDADALLYVVSRDGLSRRAMPHTKATFAAAFNGRHPSANGPSLLGGGRETYPVVSEADGLVWMHETGLALTLETVTFPSSRAEWIKEFDRRRAKLDAYIASLPTEAPMQVAA